MRAKEEHPARVDPDGAVTGVSCSGSALVNGVVGDVVLEKGGEGHRADGHRGNDDDDEQIAKHEVHRGEFQPAPRTDSAGLDATMHAIVAPNKGSGDTDRIAFGFVWGRQRTPGTPPNENRPARADPDGAVAGASGAEEEARPVRPPSWRVSRIAPG